MSQQFVAVSSGDFGIAVAQAAARMSIDMKIVIPKTAPASSIDEAIAGMISCGENGGQWVELASGAVLAGALKKADILSEDAILGLVVCGAT